MLTLESNPRGEEEAHGNESKHENRSDDVREVVAQLVHRVSGPRRDYTARREDPDDHVNQHSDDSDCLLGGISLFLTLDRLLPGDLVGGCKCSALGRAMRAGNYQFSGFSSRSPDVQSLHPFVCQE